MATDILITGLVYTRHPPTPPQRVNCSAQELGESRGGRPGLPVPDSPYGFCGRKAILNERTNSKTLKDRELCESRGGRPGLNY